MPDLATMLAAYAATYPEETERLILADWLEERGDVRGSWLRDPDLARYLGPDLGDPVPRILAALGRAPDAEALLARRTGHRCRPGGGGQGVAWMLQACCPT